MKLRDTNITSAPAGKDTKCPEILDFFATQYASIRTVRTASIP